MKIINFTAKEILPALLNGTKRQTIRPCKTISPRYRVGEKVQLMWNQRSKNLAWCAKCLMGDQITMFPNDGCMNCGAGLKHEFHKKIKVVKITETFLIQLHKGRKLNYFSVTNPDWSRPLVYLLIHQHVGEYWSVENETFRSSDYIKDMAQREGFKDPNEMFKWFDRYDLPKLKKMWVYRWEDIK